MLSRVPLGPDERALPRRELRTGNELGDGTRHRQLVTAAARESVLGVVALHESATLERSQAREDGAILRFASDRRPVRVLRDQQQQPRLGHASE